MKTFTKPSLKLFISLDAIGSTEFKNADINRQDNHFYWNKFFITFEKIITNLLYELYSNDNYSSIPNYPYFWKSLGDELIYVIDLKKYNNLHLHIEIFIEIIRKFNEQVKQKGYGLCIKGSAWTAGFPISNTIIADEDFPPDKTTINKIENFDFIGPSIDLGFRISKFSNIDRFIVNIDIALILSLTCSETLFYDGKQDLRGVGHYPIFWLQAQAKPSLESRLHKSIELTPDDIIEYCNQYLFSSTYKFIPPIIVDDKINIEGKQNEQFKQTVTNLNKKIEEFAGECEERIKKINEYVDAEMNISTEKDVPDEPKSSNTQQREQSLSALLDRLTRYKHQ